MKNCNITDSVYVDLGTISSYPGLALSWVTKYHERYVETEEWQTSGSKRMEGTTTMLLFKAKRKQKWMCRNEVTDKSSHFGFHWESLQFLSYSCLFKFIWLLFLAMILSSLCQSVVYFGKYIIHWIGLNYGMFWINMDLTIGCWTYMIPMGINEMLSKWLNNE